MCGTVCIVMRSMGAIAATATRTTQKTTATRRRARRQTQPSNDQLQNIWDNNTARRNARKRLNHLNSLYGVNGLAWRGPSSPKVVVFRKALVKGALKDISPSDPSSRGRQKSPSTKRQRIEHGFGTWSNEDPPTREPNNIEKTISAWLQITGSDRSFGMSIK